MNFLSLIFKSARSRSLSLSLAIISIAIGTFLLLGVDIIRKEVKNNFLNTIKNTDLIVGSRGSDINLLLYSVFGIGDPANNISYSTYQKIVEDLTAKNLLKFSLPISLGDSYQGFRVVATTKDFFQHYQYGNEKNLSFENGREFQQGLEVVIGYDVAKTLELNTEKEIFISHGLVSTEFTVHKNHPFKIVGQLNSTGTPIDQIILISLESMEGLHQPKGSSPMMSKLKALKGGNDISQITAFFIGLKNKIYSFKLQRQITEYRDEPLTAILPGATLAKLWRTLLKFEQVLLVISLFVLFGSIINFTTILLITVNARRKEMCIYRSIGAKIQHVFSLYLIESFFVITVGYIFGIALVYLFLTFYQFFFQSYGIQPSLNGLDFQQIIVLLSILVIGLASSLLPGWISYRHTLQDGIKII